MMEVNKGFVAMMPQDKPTPEEYIVDNRIKFTVFNKEFSFSTLSYA